MTNQNDSPDDPPPTYAAEQGREDRDGEMTGAINVNMILSMVPVTAWCFFIGPAWFGFATTMTIGLRKALTVPPDSSRN